MSMVSPKFSLPEWTTRIRQPVFLATLVSIGFHGLVFAAVPLLSQDSDALEEPESVSVVELTPDELARLPDFAQRDAFNFDNFGNPLVTQDGVPLPVPGEIPLGEEDFTNFDGGFLGMLPPTTLDGGDSFDDGFNFDDSFSGDAFGEGTFDEGGFDGGFDSAFVGGTNFDAGSLGGIPPMTDDTGFSGSFGNSQTPPPDLPADPPSGDISNFDSEIDEALTDPMLPPTQFDAEGNIIPPPDRSGQSNEVAINNEDSQSTEDSTNQTFPEGAGPEISPLPEPTEDGEANGPVTPEPKPPAPATLAPAEEDLRAEIQARRKYRPDDTPALGEGEAIARVSEIQDTTEAQLRPKQILALELPQDFPNCAAEVRLASFLAMVNAEGALSTVERLQGTGFPALDEIAETELRSRAAALSSGMDPITETPVPALYSLDVTFEDPPRGCRASALS